MRKEHGIDRFENGYQGLLGLDRLSKSLKLFNWLSWLILATLMTCSWSNRMLFVSERLFEGVLFALGPTCLAVAWLRLTGVRWRYALTLFLISPIPALVLFLFLWFYAVFLAN